MIWAINNFEKVLKTLQAEDLFISSLTDFIQIGTNPFDSYQAAYICSISISLLLQNYFWHNMEAKISQHLVASLCCQAHHKMDKPKPPQLTSMP
jgi:hypothetical protein